MTMVERGQNVKGLAFYDKLGSAMIVKQRPPRQPREPLRVLLNKALLQTVYAHCKQRRERLTDFMERALAHTLDSDRRK